MLLRKDKDKHGENTLMESGLLKKKKKRTGVSVELHYMEEKNEAQR